MMFYVFHLSIKLEIIDLRISIESKCNLKLYNNQNSENENYFKGVFEDTIDGISIVRIYCQ